MAHSSQKRAEAVADYLGGMGWDETAAKHGISKASLAKWVKDAEAGQKLNSSEIRAEAKQAEFNALLERFLIGSLEMLVTWTEICKDKGFVKLDPKGAHELGQTVLDRADRLVALVRPSAPGSDDEKQGRLS